MKHRFATIVFLVLLPIVLAPHVTAQPLSKRIDNLPLYGQPNIERSAEMRKLDEEFIATAVAGLGTRERASDAWWAEGERFVAERNFDYAMRRYNQAWLLNPSGFKPWWGIARVLMESGRPDEAQMFFARAISLVNDKFQEPAVITDAANSYVAIARRSEDAQAKHEMFAKADELYAKALVVDPEYGNAYKRSAMSFYYQGKYAAAWKMLREAERRPSVVVPRAFVDDLARAMPEPSK